MISGKYMRAAFSMITAIFVIVLLASVALLVMNLSGRMVEETTSQYRHEQAVLYAKSYTEFAVMAASSQDCVRRITGTIQESPNGALSGDGYFVEVKIQYIGNELNGVGACSNTNLLGSALSQISSKGAIVLIDTYVHYRDPLNPNTKTSNDWNAYAGTVFHRRTLQRL